MPALHIINSYNELLALPDKSPENIIAFYQSHLLILSNVTSLDTEDEITAFVAINDWYTKALTYKKQFNNALVIINKVLPMIDSSIEKINYLLFNSPTYQAIMFSKAMSCTHLKDYSSAYPILKKLVEADPENDMYKVWLRASDHGRQRAVLNILEYTFGVMILVGLFKNYIDVQFIKKWISLIGAIGFIACMIYEYDLKRHFRTAKV
jgi:tetratricopeptide (TPR) repeat protein